MTQRKHRMRVRSKITLLQKIQHLRIFAHWNLPRGVSIDKKSELLLQYSQHSFISERSGVCWAVTLTDQPKIIWQHFLNAPCSSMLLVDIISSAGWLKSFFILSLSDIKWHQTRSGRARSVYIRCAVLSIACAWYSHRSNCRLNPRSE